MDDNALAGVRILVTRAVGQAEKLTAKLQAHGASIQELPLIEIKEPLDFAPLDACLKKLGEGGYDWLVFASANAVRFTIARAKALAIPIHDLLQADTLRTAVVGEATARAAAGFGLRVDFAPRTYVADFLVEEFPGYPNLKGKSVFWPRTNIGRDTIKEGLTAAGAEVDCAVAYLTTTPQITSIEAQKLVQLLQEAQIDVITLTSSQAAQNLAAILHRGLNLDYQAAPGALGPLLANVKLAAIGPVTADTARQCLGKIDIVAGEHTMAGLTEALLASLKFKQKPS